MKHIENNITTVKAQNELNNHEKEIEVLLFKPRMYPQTITVENTAEALATVIGSSEIELTPHPFDDYAVIISSTLEAYKSMQNNRALRCPNSEIILGYNGNLLIVGGTREEGLRSLTQKQHRRYLAELYHPEVFMQVDDFMIVSQLPDELIIFDDLDEESDDIDW